jgi:glycosyltransferase involved in cell wall biosynthesis
MNLSICMIVKNEELILQKCLESIKPIADEIIITDTGSTDGTIAIAKKFTDKIYHFKWINDFSKAYAFSVSKATLPYACRWDADFLLKENRINDLLDLKKRNFDNADIVSFTWNLEFGDNKSPIKRVPHWFIFKKNKFHFASPVHSTIFANDLNAKIINIFYPQIEVDHLKDKTRKVFRYSQTINLVKKILVTDPNNLRILFSYAEGLVFDKSFSEAIEVFLKYFDMEKTDDEKKVVALENLLLCYLSLGKKNEIKKLLDTYYKKYSHNPRFILAYADTTVLFNLPKAEKFYLKYLSNPLKLETSVYLFDFERHFIHPNLVLGQIYFQTNNLSESQKYLNVVYRNSTMNKTKQSAMLLLDKIRYLQR